jgi:hypothetical protein
MSNLTTHHGGCHCGAVRYTVEIDLATPALSCNCSMCGRAGGLLSFVPADKFTLDQGADSLTDYLFNKHVVHHTFCKTCGIKPFARGKGPKGETVAINLRTVDGLDVFAIPTTQYDGKSR